MKFIKEEVRDAINQVLPNDMNINNTVFFCIGTDRSTGDSFAPLVGKMLKDKGYLNVMGTIDDPVHAVNLADKIKEIPEGKYVIAIDACLGQTSSVGLTEIAAGSLKAGQGVGKDLPEVGDFKIASVVNVGGFMEYFVLQNTRLSLVMELAEAVTDGLIHRFPIVKEEVVLDSQIGMFMTKARRKLRVKCDLLATT